MPVLKRSVDAEGRAFSQLLAWHCKILLYDRQATAFGAFILL